MSQRLYYSQPTQSYDEYLAHLAWADAERVLDQTRDELVAASVQVDETMHDPETLSSDGFQDLLIALDDADVAFKAASARSWDVWVCLHRISHIHLP